MRRAVLALVLFVASTACDGGDDSRNRRLLELRPVLAATPPPCAGKAPKGVDLVLPLTAGDKTECLALGEPIVDATDVRSATVADTPGGDPALSVILGSAGSSRLDGFAQRNQGQRLAIVADTKLVSAPTVHFTSFAGRVQVTGLSKEKTDDLFRRLNKLIKD